MSNGGVIARDGFHYLMYAALLKKTGLMDKLKEIDDDFLIGSVVGAASNMSKEERKNHFIFARLKEEGMRSIFQRYLKRGEFYLGVENGNLAEGQTLKLFYVNPVNWDSEYGDQHNTIGMIYLGFDGIVALSGLNKPYFTKEEMVDAMRVRGEEIQGFNGPEADCGLLKEFPDGKTYFRDMGMQFFHIPMVVGELGVLNWWW